MSKFIQERCGNCTYFSGERSFSLSGTYIVNSCPGKCTYSDGPMPWTIYCTDISCNCYEQ